MPYAIAMSTVTVTTKSYVKTRPKVYDKFGLVFSHYFIVSVSIIALTPIGIWHLPLADHAQYWPKIHIAYFVCLGFSYHIKN